MLKKQKIPLYYSLPAIISSILFSAAIIYAWTGPSGPPPTLNAGTPLNVSSIGQSKAGGLILNTGGAATGLIVDTGNVGIGTTVPDPNFKLTTTAGGVKVENSSAQPAGYFSSTGGGRAIQTGTGSILFANLAGAGTRMVVTDASGVLSTQAISGGGSVTSVGSGAGLTGGPITTTGTLALNTVDINVVNCTGATGPGKVYWDAVNNRLACGTDQTGGGGGLGGSGTANYISKWTAGTTLGNSIIYDNGTNVGIGTNNPTSKLTIYTSDSPIGILSENSRTSGNNFGMASWVTGSGAAYNNALTLTASGAASNVGLRIGSVAMGPANWAIYSDSLAQVYFGGNVGIGTGAAQPAYALQVAGSAGKPGGGSWSDSSDIRLKKNVQTIGNALEKMLKLRGVTYQWKEPAKHGNMEGTYMSMVAQEVAGVFPEWVGVDNEGYLTLGFIGFEALTVEAIKELQAENEALKARIEALEAKLNLGQ